MYTSTPKESPTPQPPKPQHRTTHPPGYESNHHAIMDLCRFGPGIWGIQKFAALLFHAERSTQFGKQADAHSQSQAVEGIYSRKTEQWIRGPAGISAATWKRANTELAATGILTKERRTNDTTGHAATEWAINWLAVRGAIAQFQDTQPRKITPTPWLTQSQALGSHRANPLAHTEPSPLAQPEPHISESNSEEVTTKIFTVSEYIAPEPQAAPAHQIRQSLECIFGFSLKTNDAIPGKLAAIADKLEIPIPLLTHWMNEKAKTKAAANYQITSPGAVLKFAQQDLIPWARQNYRLFEHYQNDIRNEAAYQKRLQEPIEMPEQPLPTCSKCGHPEWNRQEFPIHKTCCEAAAFDARAKRLNAALPNKPRTMGN